MGRFWLIVAENTQKLKQVLATVVEMLMDVVPKLHKALLNGLALDDKRVDTMAARSLVED